MNLKEVYNTLPDVFTYKNEEYKIDYYSMDIYATKKYPTRSKEITYINTNDTKEIRIYKNNIELGDN